MALKRINYQGFRNLVDGELHFADDYNFIIGENGAGKTNLLEAIFYVGLASSFRARDEKNLICSGKQFLRIDAETEEKNAFLYLDGNKKKLVLQGNEVRRLSEFIGWLGITLLSIEDLWIVRGAPSKRRAFLDWAIAKISPAYLDNLIEYRKILRQRNKILQSAHDNGKLDLLELFDEQMIKIGNEIYREREKKISELKEDIIKFSSEFGMKKFTLRYHSTCPEMRLDHTVLKRVREKELIFGHTLVGPHRDDLLFFTNGHPLKHYASEGEERAAAISLKLAESEMLYRKTKSRPVLLLDEAGAELDTVKKETFLNLLKGQIFYASTQAPRFIRKEGSACRVFSVKKGQIEVSA
ncbi:MAG TPA: DNA replication and repair protein RecF [candidate division WOR-3 bacterium]|uniref:DNA replication and repair protein RecF n=1 Tax=candidate division WOR-3 bacterium TaxID=2052148 RepID=A0A9C9EL25_UNCW3|nr:DNA replication and repair protein RecF [candidate division WOR-3 bacterium]